MADVVGVDGRVTQVTNTNRYGDNSKKTDTNTDSVICFDLTIKTSCFRESFFRDSIAN